MNRILKRSLNGLAAVGLTLGAAGVGQAQEVIQSFTSAARDSVFGFSFNPTAAENGAYLNLTDLDTLGAQVLKVDYKVSGTEAYGGQDEFGLTKKVGQPYFDFSDSRELVLRYKILKAATNTSTNLRITFLDASGPAGGPPVAPGGGAGEYENWYFQMNGILTATPTAGGTFMELHIPLKESGSPEGNPADDGFSNPHYYGQAANGKLDFDKIAGITFVLTTGVLPEKTNTGTFLFDDLRTAGFRNAPLLSFDSMAGSEILGPYGTATLTATVLPNGGVFGNTAATRFDYDVAGNEQFGGSRGIEYKPTNGSYFAALDTVQSLRLFYNNLTPFAPANNDFVLRVRIIEGAAGEQQEVFYYQTAKVLSDVRTGFQSVRIPLNYTGVNTNLEATTPDSVLVKALFEGQAGTDSRIDLKKISSLTFFFVDLTQNGGPTTGSIVFDDLLPSGYRETDVVGPDIAQAVPLIVTSAQFANIISPKDISTTPDGKPEVGEHYNVYASDQAFTATTNLTEANDHVELIGSNLSEADLTVQHRLYSAVSNKSVTYFYAVQAFDSKGNASALGFNPTAVTNTAKGIPTISLTGPANFVADGDVSEFIAAGITPIEIGATKLFNHYVPNRNQGGSPTDADLSAKVYLAFDNQFLYVAYDVIDDAFIFDPARAAALPYENDGTELYIGLYNDRGPKHTGFQQGAEPDYKIQFFKDHLRRDAPAGADLYIGTPDGTQTANYFIGPNFPSGYVIEAKIPRSTLQTANERQNVLTEGMRIALDIVFQDADVLEPLNDSGGQHIDQRQGILTYSPNNNDNSYQSPTHWLYTFLGNSDNNYAVAQGIGVADDRDNRPAEFRLSQNQPNPFNPTTEIHYALPTAGRVSLRVYDLLGHQVATLVDGVQQAGTQSVRFDGANLPSGVYLYRLQAGDRVTTRKMSLVK